MQNTLRFQRKLFFFPNLLRSFSIQPTEIKEQNVNISKESLIKMRKDTGYSYAKCRKALLKFGEQNYSEALRWIKDVAVKEGWEKAAKLSGRNASQGLCALLIRKNIAAMIELNCETDFVSKSEEFHILASQLTADLFNYAENLLPLKAEYKYFALNELKNSDGYSFEEIIVTSIGRLGENIKLNRAKVFYTSPEFSVFGHAHPNEKIGQVEMGRFVSIVSIRRREENSGFPIEKLGRQICHHIIGMVPETLGEAFENKERKEEQNKNIANEDYDEKDDDDGSLENMTKIDENESQLMQQSFMLNPQQKVYEYLNYHGADVKDFLRLELGQSKE